MCPVIVLHYKASLLAATTSTRGSFHGTLWYSMLVLGHHKLGHVKKSNSQSLWRLQPGICPTCKPNGIPDTRLQGRHAIPCRPQPKHRVFQMPLDPRSVLLMKLTVARGGTWFAEQPASSLLAFYPRMDRFLTDTCVSWLRAKAFPNCSVVVVVVVVYCSSSSSSSSSIVV